MRDADIRDLSTFLAELHRETDRGLALVAAALIDQKLLETLQSFFCPGKAAERLLTDSNAPLASFSARIEACFALGLIDDFEYQEITLIRKVRNEFAHKVHGFSFSASKVEGLCASLKSDLPRDAEPAGNEARFRFTMSTVCIVLRLYYRAAYVAKEQRKPTAWVDPDQSRWRVTAEAPPPIGVPVIGIGKRKPKNA